MSPKNKTQNSEGFTVEEQAAMKARAKELKTEASANKKREDGEKDVLEKIAELTEPDRTIAERLHAIITKTAPSLWPKTWYGMPAYALEGKVVCHFQSASKFKTRYSTLGFSDMANLDEGAMWPVAFALKELTATEEKRIIALLKNALC